MIFFMETNDNQIIDPRGNPLKNSAKLTIGRTFEGGFTYTYSQMEFVISAKHNTVDFHLHSHLQDHEVSIASVCSTLRLGFETAKIPQTELSDECIEGIRITFQYFERLLLSIGIVVKIRAKGNSSDEGVLLLCDPQVGSGPP
jgi:hypothetical protein